MPGDARKRAAIYARSSSNTRTTETQIETCRRAADDLGLDIVAEFADEDVSGATAFSSRSAARRLLGAIEERSVEAVLVYRLDRIATIATPRSLVRQQTAERGAVTTTGAQTRSQRWSPMRPSDAGQN